MHRRKSKVLPVCKEWLHCDIVPTSWSYMIIFYLSSPIGCCKQHTPSVPISPGGSSGSEAGSRVPYQRFELILPGRVARSRVVTVVQVDSPFDSTPSRPLVRVSLQAAFWFA